MINYILKRIITVIVMLFFLMFVFYLIMRSLPSGYIQQQAYQMSQNSGGRSYEEILQIFKEKYGMNNNVFVGYFLWLGSALRGQFGDSWYYGDSVIHHFGIVILNSFILAMIAFILAILIAIPLGIIAAKKQYSKTDYTISIVALIGISLPTFFVATILQYIFSIAFHLFPMQGTSSEFINANFFTNILDIASHFVLPAVVLTLANIGSLMRFTRTNMLEVLSADYVRTARAKGLEEHTVIYRHAFKNTFIPLVTILSSMLPTLLSGAMVTETIFVFNGIGNTAFNAIIHGDIPFTMFYLTFLSILILLGNLLADIVYVLVDPRVRLS